MSVLFSNGPERAIPRLTHSIREFVMIGGFQKILVLFNGENGHNGLNVFSGVTELSSHGVTIDIRLFFPYTWFIIEN
jgi:hypothetical protein